MFFLFLDTTAREWATIRFLPDFRTSCAGHWSGPARISLADHLMPRLCVLAFLGLLATSVTAADPVPDPAASIGYSEHVRPLLMKYSR